MSQAAHPAGPGAGPGAGHRAGHGAGGGGNPLAPVVEDGFTREITPQPAASERGVGPVMTDERYRAYLDGLAAHPLLSDGNVRLPEEAAAGPSRLLLTVGGAAVLGAFALGVPVHGLRHAFAAFEVGVFAVLAICLGSLFGVMIGHAFNAQWSTTIRRVMEQAASLIWLPVVLMGVVVAAEFIHRGATGSGILFRWLDADLATVYWMEHKSPYFNPLFFLARAAVYGVAWVWLAWGLRGMSVDQDATGDRTLSARMRRRGTFGLLLFAITVAFAAFDFLMSLDPRFFSTMWGVYYFGGAAMSGFATAALVLSVLRLGGRLTGLVTAEHFHDLGKLVFSFTIFWAYVSFSQYFLIWYSNIPEETIFMLERSTGRWAPLFFTLAIGHFVVPFLILISRKVKRSTLGLAVMSGYLLLMQVLDMAWIIRPMVDPRAESGSLVALWLDVLAPVGMLCLFAGLLIRQLSKDALIPIRDPRLGASMGHKNYV